MRRESSRGSTPNCASIDRDRSLSRTHGVRDNNLVSVDRANAAARENGLDIEYVVIVHRGHNGEMGDPNIKGTRGHVDGDRLFDVLKSLNPKITKTSLPPLKYRYSIDAAMSNKFVNPGYTNPDPKYRVVIKF